MANVKQKSIGFIQGFRGIAALIVVLWHGSRFVSPYGSGGIGDRLFFQGASMGVDLFFLISGFVMVITTKTNAHLGEFAVKRLTRILPIYIFLTLSYVFIAKGGWQYLDNFKESSLLIHSLTFIPASGAPAPPFTFPTLPVGWTLNYEIYFYFVFGVSLVFGRMRWAFFFSYFVLTLVAVPVFFSTFTLNPFCDYGFRITYVDLLTNPIIWMFVAGVLVGLLYTSRITITPGFYAHFILFAAVGLVVWQYMSEFRANHGIAMWGLSLVPLMVSFALIDKSNPVRIPGWLRYLGDISFSLYLVHPIVQEGLQNKMVALGLGVYATGWSMLFATTWLSVVLACLSHRYIEVKLGTLLKDALLRVIPAPLVCREQT
jgi:exopolysaccharide production protein ExoZ